MSEQLTAMVLRYQGTGEGMREILAAVALRVWTYPRYRYGMDDDACGDFWLHVHPRLQRMVGGFRYTGVPFENYLKVVLAWQLRNFLRERMRRAAVERDVTRALSRECAPEEAPPLHLDAARLAALRLTDARRRQLLFLVLKCAWELEGMDLAPLAQATGISEGRIRELALELRCRRERWRHRWEKLNARRARAVSGLYCGREEVRGRKEAAEMRMARVRLAPTNADIAEVLGIPKGTVDSGLYWLRRGIREGIWTRSA